MKAPALLLTHLAAAGLGLWWGNPTSPGSAPLLLPAKASDRSARHTGSGALAAPAEITAPSPTPAADPAIAFADALRGGTHTEEHRQIVADLFAAWLARDSAAALQWLASSPAMRDWDLLVSVVIDRVHHGDPLAFIAAMGPHWGVENRWTAIRGLADWCGEGRLDRLSSIYHALQPNEHRSFLIGISNQEPSPAFLRWLEENQIADTGYYKGQILNRLMDPNGSTLTRPDGWRERCRKYLAEIEDLAAHDHFKSCFESVLEHDREEREREKLLDAFSVDLEQGLRRASEWTASQEEGEEWRKLDLLESSRYKAWRDPVFAAAMQRHADGDGSIQEALELYEIRLQALEPAVRELLVGQALKSAIDFDPAAAIPLAEQRVGSEKLAKWYSRDRWTFSSIEEAAPLLPSLLARDGWRNQLGATRIDEFVTHTAEAFFRHDEVAGLAWARMLPSPGDRATALKALAGSLEQAGRQADARSLIQEASR